MTAKREERAQKIIEAIRESKGLLTLAAKKVGVSYWTVWKYSKDFPTVKKAVDESREGLLDLAEGRLYQAINDGNLTAIIFYLKTKGKARGYVERSEITGENGPLITHISVVSENAKKLTEEILEGKGTE